MANFQGSDANILITFDLRDLTYSLFDSTNYGAFAGITGNMRGALTIKAPDGQLRVGSIDNPDTSGMSGSSGGTRLKEGIPMLLDSNGDMINGEYIFTYAMYDNNGVSWQKVIVANVEYVAPVVNLAQDILIFQSRLYAKDLTSYFAQGWTLLSLVRDHKLFYPADLMLDPIETGNQFINVNPIYTNTWVQNVSSVATFRLDDEVSIRLIDELVGSSTFSVIYTPSLKELKDSVNSIYALYKKAVLQSSSSVTYYRSYYDLAIGALAMATACIVSGDSVDYSNYANDIVTYTKALSLNPPVFAGYDDKSIQVVPVA